MKICGIDFTSAPGPAKPLTCAVGELHGSRLSIESLKYWKSFAGFESFLSESGSWTAAVDFPIGQPLRLVKALGWPVSWDKYVKLVGQMSKTEFVDLIDKYRTKQPQGDKHHMRLTDELAGSCSPMMLYGVPVGKMFFEGAPRLQKADVSVLPCRPLACERIVIEAYPALVARHCIGSGSYKSDKRESAERKEARRRIVEKCQTSVIEQAYGIKLELSDEITQIMIDDSTGDSLDAVLCAVQAAAFQLDKSLIPESVDPAEGWIADPTY